MPDSKSKHFYQPTHFKIPDDKLKNLMLIPMEHPLKSEVFRAILVETKGVTSKMKRCIILVILACVLFASIGIAEDSEKFVFRNGITWGMSPEEVSERELASLVAITNFDGMYVATDVSVSKFTANLRYQFKDGQLFMSSYTFQHNEESSNEIVKYLFGALSLKYGEGTSDSTGNLGDMFKLIDGKYAAKHYVFMDLYKYHTLDGTDIYLYRDGDGRYSCASIVYFNEGLFEELYGLYNTDGL